jgi:hypothetical protein
MQSNIFTNLSEWILLMTSIIALVFSIVYRSRKYILPIQLYIFASVINGIFLKSFDFIQTQSGYLKTTQIAINVYSLLEISLIFYFFYKQFELKRYRKTLIYMYILYVFICVCLWLVKGMIIGFVPALFGIENLLITIASLYYIFSFLKSDKFIDFKSSPEFIASCGILFYFSITTPFFLVYSILYSASISYIDGFSIVNNLSYSLLFFSFIKAYLCPPTKLKYSPS